MLWRLLILALLLLSANASAQENPAIAAGRQGLDAHSSGDWKACEEHFARANELMHSPVFVVYLARCKAKLDKLLEARDLYDSVIAEALPDDAPKPWQDAKRDAAGERDTVVEDIPTFVVTLVDPPEGATLTLDGQAVAANEPLSVDPGEHTIARDERALLRGHGQPSKYHPGQNEKDRQTRTGRGTLPVGLPRG